LRLLLPALLLACAPAFAQGLPPAIAAYGAEASAQCTEMGGTPRIGPAFATAIDLTGDGRRDHVVDLAGVECAKAWSAFCGSAGCPVSVWIETPEGSERRWSDHAQAWTIDGAGSQVAIVVTRAGSACPGSGTETCTERLVFDGSAPPPVSPSASVGDLAPAPRPAGAAPAAPAAPGWTLRAAQDGSPVAVSQGAGPVASLAVFCLSGEPFLAATWATQPAPETARLGFGFQGGDVTLPARREEGAGGALVIPLRGEALAGRLSGRDAATEFSVDGAAQGRLSLKGSTRAIRGALDACMPS
jgi:hypothetical protein